jgi:hypothetical protein
MSTRSIFRPMSDKDLLSSSAEAQKLSPDLVFIDGDHSYQSTKHDFDLIEEFAKIIVLHDIVDPPSPGPVQLWKEIREGLSHKYNLAEFIGTYPSWSQCMGIGVLRLKD